MKLFVKNMVCQHCIEAVLRVFRSMGLEVRAVKLGEVEIEEKANAVDRATLAEQLEQEGFELLEDKELQTVEQIKTTLIKLVHHSDSMPEVKLSVFLSENLGYAYPYLSRLFSKHVGLTIEKYFILQKIEKVKEWLSYNEKSLSEMAYDLGYKSVQHLSNQFKSVTGMSVSAYKKLDDKSRKAINAIS